MKTYDPLRLNLREKYASHVDLALWVARCNISLHSIEDELLYNYHKHLGVRCPLSRRVFKECVSRCAMISKKHMDEHLQSLSAFAITTDAWSDVRLRKYIAVTYHAVDPNTMKLFSFPRDLIYVPQSHNWFRVTNAISNAINSHISGQSVMSTVVTDNGSNFVKMAVALMGNLNENEVESSILGPDDWNEPVQDLDSFETSGWRCVCHTMQLAVLDCLDHEKGIAHASIKSLVSKVRDLSVAIRRSSSLRHQLSLVQKANDRKQLVPIIDMPTRWSTIYYMLERYELLSQDIAYLAILGVMDDLHLEILSHYELIQLRSLLKALKPMEEFVRLLEGEFYVTISQVPARLNKILANLSNMVAGNEIHTTALALHHSVKTRLGFILDRPNLALCCAALDPRYGHLDFVSDNLRDLVWGTLARWILEYEEVRPKERTEDERAAVPLPDYNHDITHAQVCEVLHRFRKLFEELEQSKRQKLRIPFNTGKRPTHYRIWYCLVSGPSKAFLTMINC